VRLEGPLCKIKTDDAKELPRNNCFMLRLGSNAGRWCNSTLDGKCRR
jgi:hypothetical protein